MDRGDMGAITCKKHLLVAWLVLFPPLADSALPTLPSIVAVVEVELPKVPCDTGRGHVLQGTVAENAPATSYNIISRRPH